MELIDNYNRDVQMCMNPPNKQYVLAELGQALADAERLQHRVVYFVATGKCWLVTPTARLPPIHCGSVVINHNDTHRTDWVGVLGRKRAEFLVKLKLTLQQFREVLPAGDLATLYSL